MKTTNPKEFIELLDVFVIALTNNLIDKFEIIKWTDQIVISDEEPDEFIIELSLYGDKNINDFITLINEFIGLDKPILSGRVILALLYHKYKSGQIDLGKITFSIDWLVVHSKLSETEKGFLYGLDDEYLLAKSKIAGVLIEIEKWTLDFLAIYSDFTMDNFEEWKEINKQVEINIEEIVNQQKNDSDN
jgi:hypothetical protein